MNDNISDKDKKDWQKFINSTEKLPNKDFEHQKKKNLKIRSIDLHGYTLDEANKTIEDWAVFIYRVEEIKATTAPITAKRPIPTRTYKTYFWTTAAKSFSISKLCRFIGLLGGTKRKDSNLRPSAPKALDPL